MKFVLAAVAATLSVLSDAFTFNAPTRRAVKGMRSPVLPQEVPRFAATAARRTVLVQSAVSTNEPFRPVKGITKAVKSIFRAVKSIVMYLPLFFIRTVLGKKKEPKVGPKVKEQLTSPTRRIVPPKATVAKEPQVAPVMSETEKAKRLKDLRANMEAAETVVTRYSGEAVEKDSAPVAKDSVPATGPGEPTPVLKAVREGITQERVEEAAVAFASEPAAAAAAPSLRAAAAPTATSDQSPVDLGVQQLILGATVLVIALGAMQGM